jgi:hypothetical protein
VWAKVKGLKVARERFPNAEYIVFLDSDAAIAPKYTNLPFQEMIADMERLYDFDFKKKSVLLASEIRGWWEAQCMGRNLSYAPNGGFVTLRKHPTSTQFLEDWWMSVLLPFMKKGMDTSMGGMDLPPEDHRTQHIGEQKMLTVLALQPEREDYVAIIHREKEYGPLYAHPEKWTPKSRSKCMFLMVEQECFFDHYYGGYKEGDMLHPRSALPQSSDLVKAFMAVLCEETVDPAKVGMPDKAKLVNWPVLEQHKPQFRTRVHPQHKELCARYATAFPTFGNFSNYRNDRHLARRNLAAYFVYENLSPYIPTLSFL